MLTISINPFAQQALIIPLKIVRSIGWVGLGILTLPFFIISGKSFCFFTKKAVAVWSKNTTETTIKVDKINPNTKNSFETILKKWVAEAPEQENRVKAQQEIRNFFQKGDSLNLKQLNLTSLPDIFNDPRFNKAKQLHLSDNQLTSLPESFSNLPALSKLYLIYNQLTSLPESFGNLQALSKLDLSCNQLTSLPESFGNLQALSKLDLTKNQLRSLPESFGNLQALSELDLSYNQLRSLPESFGNLQALSGLDLRENQLTSLPESFSNLPALSKLYLIFNQLTSLSESFGNLGELTVLNLDNNQLTSLPESFGNLQALSELHLSYNQLTSLPESFGNLQALSKLDLRCNQLTSLPESFGNLQALSKLDLRCNQLTSLPESFSNLPALSKLDLSDNQLTPLPESFSNLQALSELDLIYNQLTSLPESFGNLQALSKLDLSCNQLTSLPESFGNLQALSKLDLSENLTLNGIPREMLQLSSNCEIELTGCGLSMDVLERLREVMSAPNYSGPLRISYSIAERNLEAEKSIEESLNSLYAIIGKIPREFAELKKTPELRSWLHRLSYTADYKTSGEIKRAFAERIIAYLNQANDDTAFRTTFYQIIQDASETCGDRVTLSVLHLSIAHQLATTDLKDMKKLADFLIKGPWTMEMLEKIARNKISALFLSDEIEVYLGYPIALKQKLQIPIDVQDMLYFVFSALKPEDLEEAKNFVLRQRENTQARLEFLISSNKWKNALSINYSEEYQAILDKRAKASEQADADYSILEQEYKKDLIALTTSALCRQQTIKFNE